MPFYMIMHSQEGDSVHDAHLIPYYLATATEYICALGWGIPASAVAALEREHPALRQCEALLNAYALAGDADQVRAVGREWCRAWQTAVRARRNEDVAQRRLTEATETCRG